METTNIIGNKYKLIKQIGSGSFGSIYEGINIRTNEKVAIKIEIITDELKLLKHESNIYRLLANVDGVPKIKWYGKDELYYYMVIDLFSESLQDLLNKSKKLSFKVVLQIGINILNILMKIHDNGFIHRDIKPENFLLHRKERKLGRKASPEFLSVGDLSVKENEFVSFSFTDGVIFVLLFFIK